MEFTSTVLTLRLDDSSFEHFDALRQTFYPTALNRIPAHLSLFHVLPSSDEVRSNLREIASHTSAFSAKVTGLRSLGRGVAYVVESQALRGLHRELADAFSELLVAQDKQGFRPHIVIQNKVTSEEARVTLAQLQAQFVPQALESVGLDWWDYLGGPWKLRETFHFSVSSTS